MTKQQWLSRRDVPPCRLVNSYQRFEVSHALRVRVPHSVKQSQKKTRLEFLDPADVGGAIYRNVGNQSKWCDITEHLTCNNIAVRCHNVALGQCTLSLVSSTTKYKKKLLICAPRPSVRPSCPSVCNLLGSKQSVGFSWNSAYQFYKKCRENQITDVSLYWRAQTNFHPQCPHVPSHLGWTLMLFSICQSATITAGKAASLTVTQLHDTSAPSHLSTHWM